MAQTTITTATCCAVNCRVGAHYPGVLDCDYPATHLYELRPGVKIPVCIDTARVIAAEKKGDKLTEIAR